MEINIRLFQLITVALALIDLYAIYKIWFYRNDPILFKRAKIIAVVVILISILLKSIIRLDAGTVEQVKMVNQQIEQQKVLPTKVTDNTFENTSNKDITIKDKDLK